MRNRIFFVVAILLVALSLTACDVEKQMDTMVDNPSFAEPLFGKFMARAEYQGCCWGRSRPTKSTLGRSPSSSCPIRGHGRWSVGSWPSPSPSRSPQGNSAP